MKTNFLLILTFIFGLSSFAQSNAIDRLFNKFSGNENVTEVNISAKMFSLFGYIDADTKEDQETLDALKGIKSLYLMSTENKAEADKMRATAKNIRKDTFEPLMTVKDGNDDIEFLIQEKDGTVSELLMLVDSDSNFLVMSLTGLIDLEKLSKLSGIGVDGLENLDKINKKEKK